MNSKLLGWFSSRVDDLFVARTNNNNKYENENKKHVYDDLVIKRFLLVVTVLKVTLGRSTAAVRCTTVVVTSLHSYIKFHNTTIGCHVTVHAA